MTSIRSFDNFITELNSRDLSLSNALYTWSRSGGRLIATR